VFLSRVRLHYLRWSAAFAKRTGEHLPGIDKACGETKRAQIVWLNSRIEHELAASR
jgi:hypothetical protein